MKRKVIFWAIHIGCFSLIAPLPSFAAPAAFEQAKVELRKRIYHDQFKSETGTLYCGCHWQWTGKSGGRTILSSCGYQVRSQQNRAERIEWEHIVTAWVFGHQRQCWRNGGRKNCVSSDPVFRAMESDMHNLVPSIGEVNGDRSNFSYGMLPKSMPNNYGRCTSKVDFKSRTFEPRDEVKGQVARINFYMHDRYNLSMSRQQQQLFIAWDRQYPPSKWEQERDNRIAGIMGHHNPFVTGEQKWQLWHKNSAAGIPKSEQRKGQRNSQTDTQRQRVLSDASSTGLIKGNNKSKIYHFSHCSGYKMIQEKNAVYFKTETEAKNAGFRLAGNCKGT
ncbi:MULTISPECIES: endonuclease [unclassified Photorhabdus]|uniref:endonuclease n=1 Tax=unclassified Photorhabdus TaxID=2620880 RepID=UPI000DCB67C4|nr:MULTISPECIES: endonuclease [unclassified Photorhabdus]RAX00795.1 deoxyribonuclease I [Photorhabdus sp. S9-53]RAX00998.1 deoxyribonuclease I [Photorhabdus sp. S10-54]RAX05337.1 deoxyribonuclease I [Photorhabdus sp. S8-52]